MNFVRRSLTYCSMAFLWKKSETSATSEKIIRTFISEKLYFCASNLDRIIFSNVHRLPRKTSAISSSTSVTAPSIVVKFLTMKDRTSILNLASHARQIYSITKHLPLAMQINDVLSSKLKINSTKKEANQVENCRHRLQTLFQDRNQGGAGGGEAPLEKFFAPPWKNVLDIVWNYWT